MERELDISRLPQSQGALQALLENKPELAQAGFDVARMFEKKSQRLLGQNGYKRDNKQRKLSPQEIAEEVAKNMIKAGCSPQQIGAAIARILEGK